jgi:hypothetical protein
VPKKNPAFDVDLTDEARKTLGGELAREIEDAFNARSSIIADGGMIDLADWFYEQGQSAPGDLPFPGAADLTSYFITENVDAMRARLAQAVFGVRPFAFVEGRGPDASKAPTVEEFMDWQVRKGDLPLELIKTILGALLEDCYILEVSEKTETRRLTEELDVAIELDEQTQTPIFADGKPKLKMDDDGEPVTAGPSDAAARVQRTHTKTKRLGPQYIPVSMKDFVFLPGHAQHQSEVWGYAYRFWKRVPELLEAVDDEVYDADAVTGLGAQSDRHEVTAPSTVSDVAAQYEQSAEKELFQLSLKRDLDGDGREEWYVATVSLKTRDLLRLKVDTFVTRVGRPRCVPFVLFPRRNSVYGYSYAFCKLLTLAEEHTAVRNMKADRSALATNAPMMVLRGAAWDPDAQPIGVGRSIPINQPGEVTPLPIPDVPPSVVQQEALLHQAKERVGGLSDSALNVLSTEHRTLGENRLVAGGSAIRVREVVGHLHRSIAAVLELSLAIWQDTLRGDSKGYQPPSGMLAALQQRGFTGQVITADMLTGDFQFEPYGSDDLADPEVRRQRFDGFAVALANLAKSVPAVGLVLQNPDAGKAILEQLLRNYDIRDRQPFLGALMTPAAPVTGAGPGAPGQMAAPAGPALPGAPPEDAMAKLMAMMHGGANEGAPSGY